MKIYLPRFFGITENVDPVLQKRDLARAMGAEYILVVEDDHALRTYTVEILSELGYHVLEAQHGLDALPMLEASKQIDLLFTDVVMPGGMNGRQLADEALLRRPGLKILFATGYTRNAIVHHGRLDPGVQRLANRIRWRHSPRRCASFWTGVQRNNARMPFPCQVRGRG